MLARVEAYKKFVDHEKEAAIQEVQKKLAEEQAQAVRSVEERKKIYDQGTKDLIDLILDLMPHVQPDIRYKLIEWSNFSDKVKHALQETARETPDLSWPVFVWLQAVSNKPLVGPLSGDFNTKPGDTIGPLSRFLAAQRREEKK